MGNCKTEQMVKICKGLYKDKNILESPIVRSADGNVCQSFKINNPNSGPAERDHNSDTK